MAVLLGYGLMLYVILTLQPLQQKQRQERAFEHAITTIKRSHAAIHSQAPHSHSDKSIDPDLLQQVLGQLSSYNLAICMHPKGVESELVTPVLTDNDLGENTPSILLACEKFVNPGSASVLQGSDLAKYSVESGVIELHGEPWTLHLLEIGRAHV